MITPPLPEGEGRRQKADVRKEILGQACNSAILARMVSWKHEKVEIAELQA
jgi:hypothetical protein